jgi:hypothetical protein
MWHMKHNIEKILEIEKSLSEWFVNNDYKGSDPYQLDAKASKLIRKIPAFSHLRKILKPYHVFIPKSAFSSFTPVFHPKAIGLIVGGNSFLFKLTGDTRYINQNRYLIGLLKESSNREYKHYAWGSPFEWGSNPRYPVNTPAVCLIVPIANGLLDHYDATGDREALEICSDVALHIIEENGYKEEANGRTCLYYSPLDRNEVYNSNALASAFFFRLNDLTGDATLLETAKKVLLFVLDAQLSDGSWVYSNNSNIIDNRHSGFILESLSVAGKYWSDEYLTNAYTRGMIFYINHLTDKGLPKWSVDKTYPIDIHDIAQSILTFTTSGSFTEAGYITDFAISEMFNGKDEFYFKYFKNGKVNKNVFIRWGQAWMYYALAKFAFKGAETNKPEIQG